MYSHEKERKKQIEKMKKTLLNSFWEQCFFKLLYSQFFTVYIRHGFLDELNKSERQEVFIGLKEEIEKQGLKVLSIKYGFWSFFKKIKISIEAQK